MVRFSVFEVIDIIKSFTAVTLIFSLAYKGVPFLFILPIVAVFVGVSFVVHELAHKLVAHKLGYVAFYKSDDMFLLVSVVLSFFGVIFLAPGGVHVSHHGTHVAERKHMGLIALAGPVITALFAIVCLLLVPVHPVFYFGFSINCWLALFNMLPFFGMDGEKVLAWNKVVYGISAAVVLALYIMTYLPIF